jgi:hypothetical protein
VKRRRSARCSAPESAHISQKLFEAPPRGLLWKGDGRLERGRHATWRISQSCVTTLYCVSAEWAFPAGRGFGHPKLQKAQSGVPKRLPTGRLAGSAPCGRAFSEAAVATVAQDRSEPREPVGESVGGGVCVGRRTWPMLAAGCAEGRTVGRRRSSRQVADIAILRDNRVLVGAERLFPRCGPRFGHLKLQNAQSGVPKCPPPSCREHRCPEPHAAAVPALSRPIPLPCAGVAVGLRVACGPGAATRRVRTAAPE